MLDKQVQIYMLDTGHLYTDKERELHDYNAKVRQERRFYRALQDEIKRIFKDEFEINEDQFKDIIKGNTKKIEANVHKTAVFTVKRHNEDGKVEKTEEELTLGEFLVRYDEYEEQICNLRQEAKVSKQMLLDEIATRDQSTPRQVRTEDIKDSNIIATFESELTRTIDAKTNELTTNIFTLQVYYYGVFEDAMLHGVDWNGEHYVYFTSSAGMIRKKRGLFIKESLWNRKQKQLTCGLTLDMINSKGGCNTNKYLSYLALTNSATEIWEDFDIDKAIVVPDYEATVHGEVDFIDDLDYSITRQEGDYEINHIDGAGMVLPGYFPKTTMIRLPWIKGLISPFSYDEFIKEKGGTSKITDIWGLEHDIFEEDIQVIFTKSQMKMAKYYDSWDQYKQMFKEYGCHACLTNEEEEFIKNATINYQMLQQLVDCTDEELDQLVYRSSHRIEDVCKNLDTIKEVMGVNRHDDDVTPLQKSFKIYPQLLMDTYTKDTLRDLKDSLVKQARAGKLAVNGKYTFVLPDFYAACEYWFLGIEHPNGLLKSSEVFCKLFSRAPELVCLRSPSLYHETPVRENVAFKTGDPEHDARVDEIGRWFDTKGIYTSVNDLITRILQLD